MKELIKIFIAITVVLLLGCFIGSTLDNLNKTSNSKNLYEQINIGDFYQKSGEILPDAKPVFAKLLNDFGLKADATLADFKQYLLGVYK
jgi:hypothetical protein